MQTCTWEKCWCLGLKIKINKNVDRCAQQSSMKQYGGMTMKCFAISHKNYGKSSWNKTYLHLYHMA